MRDIKSHRYVRIGHSLLRACIQRGDKTLRNRSRAIRLLHLICVEYQQIDLPGDRVTNRQQCCTPNRPLVTVFARERLSGMRESAYQASRCRLIRFKGGGWRRIITRISTEPKCLRCTKVPEKKTAEQTLPTNEQTGAEHTRRRLSNYMVSDGSVNAAASPCYIEPLRVQNEGVVRFVARPSLLWAPSGKSLMNGEWGTRGNVPLLIGCYMLL